MKYQLGKLCLALGLMFLLEAGSGYAQAYYGLTAEVPFAFTAGNSNLESGRFFIKEVNSSMNIVNITSQEGKGSIILIAGGTMVENPYSSRPRLVFNKYGDRYFLSKIWYGNAGMGCQLTHTKAEKEAAQSAVSMNEKVSVIEIAGR